MKNTTNNCDFEQIKHPKYRPLFTAFLNQTAYTVNVENNTHSEEFYAINISTEQLHNQKNQSVLSVFLDLDDNYYGYNVVYTPKENDDNVIFFCSKKIDRFVYVSVRFMFTLKVDKQLSDEQLQIKYTEYLDRICPTDKINCLTKASSGQPRAAPLVPR